MRTVEEVGLVGLGVVGVAGWKPKPTTQIFATPFLLLKPSASTRISVTHAVGAALGGRPLGRGDGTNVGVVLGASVGRGVGPVLGEEDGKSVGLSVGTDDGKPLIVGSTVGDDVGIFVGGRVARTSSKVALVAREERASEVASTLRPRVLGTPVML